MAELTRRRAGASGPLDFASSGNGGISHLAGELFAGMAGVKLTHVPYKGTSPAVTDLLGGQVQMMFSVIPTALPYVKAARLRALAVTGPHPAARCCQQMSDRFSLPACRASRAP